MNRRLGQLEAAALAYVQLRNLRTVMTTQLASALGITAKQERELFSRMARTGMIAGVRRGLYLFPAKLPLGGLWTPDEATAVNALMSDKQARYQITGPAAFSRYGFDDQIPAGITLYNDSISGERTIGRIRLTLVKVTDERLGSVEQVSLPDGQTLVYSSRVRTLVDAVYDWSRFDSLPRAYEWIRRELNSGRIRPDDLARAAVRYANMGTVRRIGAWLERCKADESVLRRMQSTLTESSAKIPLVPSRPTRGALSKRWGVVINA